MTRLVTGSKIRLPADSGETMKPNIEDLKTAAAEIGAVIWEKHDEERWGEQYSLISKDGAHIVSGNVFDIEHGIKNPY
jgi:hypothetical protein